MHPRGRESRCVVATGAEFHRDLVSMRVGRGFPPRGF